MQTGHGKKKPAQARDRFDRFSYSETVNIAALAEGRTA
jgi:hypothetical protein